MKTRLLATTLAGAVVLGGAACSSKPDEANAVQVAVSSTDDSCDVKIAEVPAGSVNFLVRNDGSEPADFYLYEDDGESEVGDVKGIDPGDMSKLLVKLDAGNYAATCKPGVQSEGIRSRFVVTDN